MSLFIQGFSTDFYTHFLFLLYVSRGLIKRRGELCSFHSLWRQVHSLFQRDFWKECDLVHPLSNSSICSFPYGHPVAAHVCFLVFSLWRKWITWSLNFTSEMHLLLVTHIPKHQVQHVEGSFVVLPASTHRMMCIL